MIGTGQMRTGRENQNEGSHILGRGFISEKKRRVRDAVARVERMGGSLRRRANVDGDSNESAGCDRRCPDRRGTRGNLTREVKQGYHTLAGKRRK